MRVRGGGVLTDATASVTVASRPRPAATAVAAAVARAARAADDDPDATEHDLSMDDSGARLLSGDEGIGADASPSRDSSASAADEADGGLDDVSDLDAPALPMDDRELGRGARPQPVEAVVLVTDTTERVLREQLRVERERFVAGVVEQHRRESLSGAAASPQAAGLRPWQLHSGVAERHLRAQDVLSASAAVPLSSSALSAVGGPASAAVLSRSRSSSQSHSQAHSQSQLSLSHAQANAAATVSDAAALRVYRDRLAAGAYVPLHRVRDAAGGELADADDDGVLDALSEPSDAD